MGRQLFHHVVVQLTGKDRSDAGGLDVRHIPGVAWYTAGIETAELAHAHGRIEELAQLFISGLAAEPLRSLSMHTVRAAVSTTTTAWGAGMAVASCQIDNGPLHEAESWPDCSQVGIDH